MFSKQSAKTKIGLFLMTILCAVTLGLSASNSVMASSDWDEYGGTTDPSLTQYLVPQSKVNKAKGHKVPYKQLTVYHLKNGYKHYQAYDWNNVDDYSKPSMHIQFTYAFYIDNKLGAKTIVAPKTARYDIKVKGVKYRPFMGYHSHTPTCGYIKESYFKHAFRKGGYYNDSKAVGLEDALIMKNNTVKHYPPKDTGIWLKKNADEAAFFFGFKNNKCYELFRLASELSNYYDGSINMSPELLHKYKARFKKVAGKPYKYVPEKDQYAAEGKALEELRALLKN